MECSRISGKLHYQAINMELEVTVIGPVLPLTANAPDGALWKCVVTGTTMTLNCECASGTRNYRQVTQHTILRKLIWKSDAIP